MAASLPDTEGVMALENSFQIFVRKTGEAPQEVHVTPTTTVAEIKAQKDLKGYVCCFKGNRKDGDTMTTLGIQNGGTINVFRTAQNPAYQAAKRLQRGKAKGGTAQSTAHAHLNLHRETQEVVVEALMTENQQTREAVAEVRVGVEKLLDFHEKSPPPRLDDLDVMELVQERFKVGRMNEVLEQFDIERPRGLT